MTVIAILLVTISVILAGSVGFWTISRLMTTYSEKVLISIAEEQRTGIESVLDNIEHTASIMETHVKDMVPSREVLEQDGFVDEYVSKAEGLLLNLASNTEYADSLYIRFNPAYTDGHAGLFYIRSEGEETDKGKWEQAPLTDLSPQAAVSEEELAWWLEPIRQGHPVWVMPHVDNVLLEDTISYCIPIYAPAADDSTETENDLIGVIGVDTRVGALAQYLVKIDIYKTGSSFLTDAEEYILYHPEEDDPKVAARIERDSEAIAKVLSEQEEEGHLILFVNPDHEKIALADQELSCGLHLIVSARLKEIYADRQKMIIQTGLVMLALVGVLVALVQAFVKRMVAPIHSLIEASEKIAAGDIDNVQLEASNRDDEIGRLSKSLKVTMTYLKEYLRHVNALAYEDAMTGVRNRTSYLEKVGELSDMIAKGKTKFSVIVFDLNNLKQVNDTQGHDCGDKMITEASRLISEVFVGSDLYRIGGDEFVVISEGKAYEERHQRIRLFREKLRERAGEEHEYELVVAGGMSVFEEGDTSYEDVFRRADKAMYEEKYFLKYHKTE